MPVCCAVAAYYSCDFTKKCFLTAPFHAAGKFG